MQYFRIRHIFRDEWKTDNTIVFSSDIDDFLVPGFILDLTNLLLLVYKNHHTLGKFYYFIQKEGIYQNTLNVSFKCICYLFARSNF